MMSTEPSKSARKTIVENDGPSGVGADFGNDAFRAKEVLRDLPPARIKRRCKMIEKLKVSLVGEPPTRLTFRNIRHLLSVVADNVNDEV